MCSGNNSFRAVITGKGGVGKTTLTACLTAALAGNGITTLAVDEDPQMNLPYAMGLPVERARAIVPLNLNRDYVEEKTGARPGASGWGALFKLNPDVDDVVARYGVTVADRMNLLVMGTVKQAGGGCLCAENVLLDSVVRHLALRENEGILLDTQAGVEHFGRALSRGFSHCLVVADATFNALTVACSSAGLARQIGIPKVCLVLNRAADGAEARLDRFRQETGTDVKDRFDGVVAMPFEPRLSELEPDVTRIMSRPDSGYAVAVRSLAAALTARACSCSKPALEIRS